jgi:hypothetical protein
MGIARGKAPKKVTRLLRKRVVPPSTVNSARNTVVQKILTILWIVRDTRKMGPKGRLFSLERELPIKPRIASPTIL